MASSAREGGTTELGEALRRAVGRLYRSFRAQRPPGQLSDNAFAVLTRLHKDGPQTLTALAAEHGVSLASMSETVAHLLGAGHAMRTRDDVDRRRVLLSATADGEEFAAAARAQRHAWFDTHLALLPPDDRAVLHRAAELLQQIAEKPASATSNPSTAWAEQTGTGL